MSQYGEPWKDGSEGWIETANHAGLGREDWVLGSAFGDIQVDWREGCQARVLACVNALAGFPQEELEAMKPGGITALIQELNRLADSLAAQVNDLTGEQV